MMALLEWFGAATGIIGALLLAANIRLSPWAFVIYLLSCAAWIAFGVLTSAPGLVAMQSVFVAANTLGDLAVVGAPSSGLAKNGRIKLR